MRRCPTARTTVEPAPSGGAEAGFTLIEVLVAFVIVALVLGAVLGIFSGGLSTSRRADERARAALLASSVLAATGREQPVVGGYTEGAFDDGYTWRRWIEPYTAEPLFPPDAGTAAYRVTVTVDWPGARPHDGVTVSTLRIVQSEVQSQTTRPQPR